LIDFDFWGKANSETLLYPKGYRIVLEDGVRSREAGQRITKMNDFWDLHYILTDLHDIDTQAAKSLRPLKRLALMDSWEQFERSNNLDEMIQS